VLKIHRIGVINLHPEFLPYNRVWHTPTLAIGRDSFTEYRHFMPRHRYGDSSPRNSWNIALRYRRTRYTAVLWKLELEIFKEAWPAISSGTYRRKPQSLKEGSAHNKKDIESIRCIDLDKQIKAGNLIGLLRALTTNNIKESAYFEMNGKQYLMQLHIEPNKDDNEK
jgi:methionyl-tRNA formyltransferase